ncbi:MAG: carboxypeptidase regulatory-like domain-containing protein [Eubacterium sp.]|nr:carboxypeptidase regulatory-like domain-containing protein [Eubacterium sp.]
MYIPNLPVGNEYSYKVTKVPDGYVVSTAGEETGVEIKAKEVTEKLDKIKKEQKPTEEKTTETTTTEEQTTATTEEQVTTEATTEATTSKPTTETTEDPDDEDPDDEDPDDDSDEDKGTLVITILDEKTRTPIPNAVVTVERPDGTTGTYTTDENGQIIIRDVPTGDYKVTVTQVPPGYTVTTGVSQVVTVEKDKTTSHTALVTNDNTEATTQTTQGGSTPTNTTTQTSSVKTGDDAKVVMVMLIMSIAVIYIFSWCILRYRKRKEDK